MNYNNNPANVNQFSKPYVGQVLPMVTDKPVFYNMTYGLRAAFMQMQMLLQLNYTTVENLCLRWVICNTQQLTNYLEFLRTNNGLKRDDMIDINDLAKQRLFIDGTIKYLNSENIDDSVFKAAIGLIDIEQFI